MKIVADKSNRDLRVVIYKKLLGYRVEIFDKNQSRIIYNLRCFNDSKQSNAISCNAINSLEVGRVIYFKDDDYIIIQMLNSKEIIEIY